MFLTVPSTCLIFDNSTKLLFLAASADDDNASGKAKPEAINTVSKLISDLNLWNIFALVSYLLAPPNLSGPFVCATTPSVITVVDPII